MHELEYKKYRRSLVLPEPIITAEDVLACADGIVRARTLVLGYDLDRTTVHVWLSLQDSEPVIGVIRYRPMFEQWNVRSYALRDQWDAAELLPTKRAYVESTDLRFAEVMRDRGYPLTFTTPDYGAAAERAERWAGFQGKTSDGRSA